MKTTFNYDITSHNIHHDSNSTKGTVSDPEILFGRKYLQDNNNNT